MPQQTYDTFKNRNEDPDIRLRRQVLAVVLSMSGNAGAVATFRKRTDDPGKVAGNPFIVNATRRQRQFDQPRQLELVIGNGAFGEAAFADDLHEAFATVYITRVEGLHPPF